MEHEKNYIFKKYPTLNKIFGFLYLLIALLAAFEWNEKTNSYWGYIFLAIAVPGLFYPVIQIMKKLFMLMARQTK